MAVSRSKSQKKFDEDRRLNRIYAKPGPFDFRIVLDGLKATYDIGKIFRSAQAFGSAGIDLCGITSFNPYPALGALRYVPARFFEETLPCLETLRSEGYALIALDHRGEKNLFEIDIPKKAAFLMGHEEFGLSITAEQAPDVKWVRIPMFGQVQSLNVSVAASLVMYEYVRRYHSPVEPESKPCEPEAAGS